jgi:ditrans,polycis-polyprenyl diphosphate synthase
MLASPPVEWGINQFRELLIGALRQGPIPQHVAFVMDGNRRFARSHKIETVEGHNLGFEALARVRTYFLYFMGLLLTVNRFWKSAISQE